MPPSDTPSTAPAPADARELERDRAAAPGRDRRGDVRLACARIDHDARRLGAGTPRSTAPAVAGAGTSRS